MAFVVVTVGAELWMNTLFLTAPVSGLWSLFEKDSFEKVQSDYVEITLGSELSNVLLKVDCRWPFQEDARLVFHSPLVDSLSQCCMLRFSRGSVQGLNQRALTLGPYPTRIAVSGAVLLVRRRNQKT